MNGTRENDCTLEDLLETAKTVVLTPEEKEQQRRSFAYGNVVIENPRITREMVDKAAEEPANHSLGGLAYPFVATSKLRVPHPSRFSKGGMISVENSCQYP